MYINGTTVHMARLYIAQAIPPTDLNPIDC